MYPIEYSGLIALALLLALGGFAYVLGQGAKALLNRLDPSGPIKRSQYLICLRDMDGNGQKVPGLEKGKLYRLVAKQPDDQIRIELEPGQHLMCPAVWFDQIHLSGRTRAALDPAEDHRGPEIQHRHHA